jgi:hypothetical protein
VFVKPTTTMPFATTRQYATATEAVRFAWGLKLTTWFTETFGPLVGVNEPVAVAAAVVAMAVDAIATVPLTLVRGPLGDLRSDM